jgi:alpha-1,6-mannosyltransferase
MSILEAMACGVPPVITRGCNFDEVGSSGSGIVVDGGEDALADALARLCNDSVARDQAGAKARALVIAKYTWPIVARQMLATFEARLSANIPPPRAAG